MDNYARSWSSTMRWRTFVLSLYIAYNANLFIHFSGLFNHVKQHNIHFCEKITGDHEFKSCEDFYLFDNIAYTACDPLKLDPAVNEGGIWRVNYTHTPVLVEKFTIQNSSLDFHPLSIRLDTHPDTGEKTIIVINIPTSRAPSIDLFTIDDIRLQLIHKRSIVHPKIYTPNSLHIMNDVRFRASDGTPSFFFTNDHYFTKNDFIKVIETLFVSWSNIGFYNARLGDVEHGVSGLRFANGLAGADNILLVAETYKRYVKHYDITTSVDTHQTPHVHLHFVNEAKFTMAVDNVDYYPDRHLAIVAGHPKPLNVGYYVATKDPSVQAGTQIDVWNLETNETQTLIQDTGLIYRGSTTGRIDFKNIKLLISSIIDEGMLVCSLSFLK